MHARQPGRKRFYAEASVMAVEGGVAVLLDGRGIKTPAGRPLALPTSALAEAVASEWQGQKETIDPSSMPLTRLANVALDKTPAGRNATIDHVLEYGGTDLLCYRAEGPADLAARQEALWRPLLLWLTGTHGASLTVTTGIVPVTQPPEALAALRKAVSPLDDWSLTALWAAVEAAGSLAIGLALMAGRIDAREAFAVSQVDETYQIERWGEDAEAAARRREIETALLAAEAFHIHSRKS